MTKSPLTVQCLNLVWQVTEEQQRELTLQAELERLKLMHQNLLAQRRRV